MKIKIHFCIIQCYVSVLMVYKRRQLEWESLFSLKFYLVNLYSLVFSVLFTMLKSYCIALHKDRLAIAQRNEFQYHEPYTHEHVLP